MDVADCYLAVIENVFPMVSRMLKTQVLQQQLRRETFEQFMPKRIDRAITRTTKCILWITAWDFSQIVAFRDKITIAQFAKIRGGELHISKQMEWKLLRWLWRRRLENFTELNDFFFFAAILSNWFAIHGRTDCQLKLISNNYTKVTNENGTFSFFCYDLNSSMCKKELTL